MTDTVAMCIRCDNVATHLAPRFTLAGWAYSPACVECTQIYADSVPHPQSTDRPPRYKLVEEGQNDGQA